MIGLLMAGTLLTPAVASAQDGERGYGRSHREGTQRRADSGPRQDRAATRSDSGRQRAQPAPAQLAQRGERRGGGGEWRGRRGGSGSDSSGGWQGRRGGSGGDVSGGNWRGRGSSRNTGPVPGQDRSAWQGRRGDGRDWQQGRRDDRRDWREGRRDDRRDWRQERRGDRRDWNRDWRNDRRYAWRDWRYANRNLFRLPRYYAPYGYGYGYQRFSIGLFLDQMLFGQRYWISDPFHYRLPPAPYGTQWIRYYNDVILVDVYTGEVLDVIHDFFW